MDFPAHATLDLNCWVLGDSRTCVFPIKISKSETVGALKDAIKDKNKPIFDHIPANALVLWKVSIPADSELDQNLVNLHLVDKNSLSPVDELSEVFAEPLVRKNLHIIVRSPLAGTQCVSRDVL